MSLTRVKKGEEMVELRADLVFEASWEITNKCGGIYTVITSKVPLMQANYDTYILLGPLFDTVPNDFLIRTPPEPFAAIFSRLAEQGIRCEYGVWDIPGQPTTILIDARKILNYINKIKEDLWNDYQVDSLHSAHDFNEPLAWSWGVGKFLELAAQQFNKKKIIGHFHEWLAGFAILYLKKIQSDIATVFTTHATMLGRSVSSRGVNVLQLLDTINPEEEAKRIGVIDKYSTERACALNVDVFTTVSKTTAKEAEKLFGRKPDVLPNGLAIDSFPTFDDAILQHRKYRGKISRFVMSHFFPYQSFDISHTLFLYSSGRYEFVNKGLDVTIDALAKLNEELKAVGSKRTVVMFFFMAMNSNGPKRELLENKSYVQEITTRIMDRNDFFLQQILLTVLLGDTTSIKILPKDYLEELKKEFNFVKRAGNPFICTHQIENEENDEIIKYLKKMGLNNEAEDKIKIVFLPAYLDGTDGLLNLDYNEVVTGCHLGIFPSNYEPWGYTPLESIALGVPAITSSLSGFGQHMIDKVSKQKKGLAIINREQSREGVVHDLFDIIKQFVSYDRQSRVQCKLKAHALSTFADWRQLIIHYLDAHNKALKLHKKN